MATLHRIAFGIYFDIVFFCRHSPGLRFGNRWNKIGFPIQFVSLALRVLLLPLLRYHNNLSYEQKRGFVQMKRERKRTKRQTAMVLCECDRYRREIQQRAERATEIPMVCFTKMIIELKIFIFRGCNQHDVTCTTQILHFALPSAYARIHRIGCVW